MRIVRFHMFNVGKADTLHARRMLARYGEGLALDLLDHKEADLLGKGREGPRDLNELERLRALPRGRRAGAVEPAPALRPERRRHRPDRARLRPRARARAHAGDAARGGRRRPALNRREALLARAKALLPS